MRARHRREDARRARELAAGAGAPTVVLYDPTGEGLYPGMEGAVVAEQSVSDVAAALAEGVGAPLGDGGGGAAALVVPMSEGWEDLLTSAARPLLVVGPPRADAARAPVGSA